MLSTWLHDGTIIIRERIDNWEQAIDLCAAPLLETGVITEEYPRAIISQHHRLGPYYVLAPGLAMPHARPEEGACGMGLSLLKLHHGVVFGAEEFDPVDTVIMLAAPDKHTHIEMISALAALFSRESDLESLRQACSLAEIKSVIARY